MTIGLTWRRTARRIKRLKEGVLTISPDYSDRPTPDFLALSWKTPNPQFLLRHYHRGVYVPAEVERLKPFRVLIRSSDLPDGAAMSVEAARRIKRERPDLLLTVLLIDRLSDCVRH